MNNNIIIPSGGISHHYPIYIDIIEKDEDSLINIFKSSNSSSTSKNNNSGKKVNHYYLHF